LAWRWTGSSEPYHFLVSRFPTACYSAVSLLRAWVVWAVIWFWTGLPWGEGHRLSEIVKTAACTRGEGVWSLLIRWRWSTSDWQALLKPRYEPWFKMSPIFCCIDTCVACLSDYVFFKISDCLLFSCLPMASVSCLGGDMIFGLASLGERVTD
jgi:hypothetical protein